MVDKDSIVSIGDVEGDTFVCLVTGCSPVLVPNFNRLTLKKMGWSGWTHDTVQSVIRTVLDESAKLLSKPVNEFTRGKVKLGIDVPNDRG